MREGWKLKKLKEVCKYDKTKHNGDELPYVGLEHIESNTGRYLGDYKPLSVKSSTFHFDTSHVLYGRLRPYLNKVVVPEFEGHCSTEIFPIKLSDSLERKYLFYWLIMDSTVAKINATWTGARMPRANMNEVIAFEIPIPPLSEQQQIVAILDKAFAAIDQAKANIERNIENAKELFQSKLNEIFSQKGEGWEEKKLPEVVTDNCKLSYGIVQPGEEYPNGLPVIRPTDMKQMFVDFQNLKRINPEKAKSYKRTELSGDELLLCVRGETGGVALLTKEFEGANVTRGIVPITFNKDVLLKFGYYQFMSPYISKQIKEKTYGAALMQINIKDIKKLTIKITSIANQKEIVELLDSLNQNTCKILSLFNEKFLILEELKKSILQKAFSGELTANDAIIEDIPLAAEPAMDYQTQQPYKG